MGKQLVSGRVKGKGGKGPKYSLKSLGFHGKLSCYGKLPSSKLTWPKHGNGNQPFPIGNISTNGGFSML